MLCNKANKFSTLQAGLKQNKTKKQCNVNYAHIPQPTIQNYIKTNQNLGWGTT